MSMVLPSWAQWNGEVLMLRLYVQPGAKQTGIVGEHDGALKIRLAAPPVEGKANAALLAWLSKTLEFPQREIVLSSGDLSRHKRIAVHLTENRLEQTVLKLK